MSGAVPITVDAQGRHLDSDVGLDGHRRRSSGGTDQDGAAGRRSVRGGRTRRPPCRPPRCTTASTISGGDTIISLYNSPLKSPEVVLSAPDLDRTRAPLEPAALRPGVHPRPVRGPHARGPRRRVHLEPRDRDASRPERDVECTAAARTTARPNTARWIITIPASVLPGGSGGNGHADRRDAHQLDDSGTRTNQPPNLSRDVRVARERHLGLRRRHGGEPAAPADHRAVPVPWATRGTTPTRT